MKSDRKGRDLFYGVVAVATLIVAIVGATLAYFSISDSSSENAINATGATVSIEYNDGQQVTAQADQLIPATFAVVKSVYESREEAGNFGTASALESNICIDANNKQVCSIYRFTVKSDISRNVIATLNNEFNGFTYLSYAVRDVSNNTWLTLQDGTQSVAMNSCDNEDLDSAKHCSTGTGASKVYNANAVNSVFGYTLQEGLWTNATRPISTTAQAYDIVIFLNENNANQNVDQGKNYQGTIIVTVADGGSAEHISGSTTPTP